VNVIELGDGPPLVFVHGHSGRWQNWLNQLAHFGRTHRVVALDLPGFGYSPMPSERITIENYGRSVDALLVSRDITAAPVVGNSMGGFVAAETAIKSPQRVERLLLASAAGLATRYVGLPNELLRRRSLELFARTVNTYAGVPEARAQTLVRRPRLRQAVLQMLVTHPDRLSAPMCAEVIRGAGRPAAPFATNALVTYDYRDRVSEIECPTLIVWGTDDRVVPPSGAQEYHELIERSELVMMDDTGHLPMIERPARFNSLLEEFLAEGPANGAA
jgi:pimeloyl-ACP methyl ester carboxylesterase